MVYTVLTHNNLGCHLLKGIRYHLYLIAFVNQDTVSLNMHLPIKRIPSIFMNVIVLEHCTLDMTKFTTLPLLLLLLLLVLPFGTLSHS